MAYVDPRVVCTPWITSSRLCNQGSGSVIDCDGSSTALAYPFTDDEIIQAACNILFVRTCFRYPGLCEREVWPCLDCCSCGSHPCCCGPYRAIELTSDYPIQSIEEITIDGITVNPSVYRLDENSRIVRTDMDHWPCCNNLGLNGGMRGADVRVRYTTGRQAPIQLQMAAKELADELKKACNGDPSCQLPSHVRSVTRRGVEFEVNDLVTLLINGLTGNPIIDHAISIYGKCNKSSMFDATVEKRKVRIS